MELAKQIRSEGSPNSDSAFLSPLPDLEAVQVFIRGIGATIRRDQMKACVGLLELIEIIENRISRTKRRDGNKDIFISLIELLQNAFSELMAGNPEAAKRHLRDALREVIKSKGSGENLTAPQAATNIGE